MKSVAVIPVYNEEKTVALVAKEAGRFVDKVIVVDDGSEDQTSQEARGTDAEVVVLPKNMGKAKALKTGFEHCRNYEIVVMLDGDLQHSPSEIPLLIEGIKSGSDLCIGNRLQDSPKGMPILCRFSNRIASLVISFLAGQKITDPQCGFRAIKGEKLGELELKADRYAMEHIMILECARKRFKIKEVPISCIYGGEKSGIKPLRDTLKVIFNILRFVLK